MRFPQKKVFPSRDWKCLLPVRSVNKRNVLADDRRKFYDKRRWLRAKQCCVSTVAKRRPQCALI